MEDHKSKDTGKIIPQNQKVERKPNEIGGFDISTHLKIFDPNTKKVIVQKRGDN